MNCYENSVLLALMRGKYKSQRELSLACKLSLGLVNKTINNLLSNGYIDSQLTVRENNINEVKFTKPERAIILAAGYGMRMIPIGTDVPKALLEVKSELLVERQIRQLKEKGINEIYIVVGYLKEMFDYLVEKYGVHIILNENYHSSNNLYSLYLVADKLNNTYVIPSDIYSYINPFDTIELSSWYMMGSEKITGTGLKVNRNGVIQFISGKEEGNRVLGIAYINDSSGDKLRKNIYKIIDDNQYLNSFWEEAVFNDPDPVLYPRLVSDEEVIEINTYADLRNADEQSDHLQSDIIKLITEEMSCSKEDITDIKVMKKGMTNRSFQFTVFEKTYIMRVPGEGTEQLINRRNEFVNYQIIKDKYISDNVVYISENNGYKITEFWHDTRECNPEDKEDVKRCMAYLRNFHQSNFEVPHEFDLFRNIDYYESLWKTETLYKDYKDIKHNVLGLKGFIEANIQEKVLAHIDSVPDNFLFTEHGIKLIDWEYAGMQDPHVDIAMFAIYSLYELEQIDELIELYFEYKVEETIRMKIYGYIAVCGLLWSNWCEYKRMLGVEFGEYSMKQYRYAKEFSSIVGKYIREEWNYA
ncbi:NTP transferase domain-containing protein [Proteiniclasticum sp.]|uniref:NTP transferase domain-containing protein n=1 Tax=Proteiniclasticum sp. TaxID=2053595 RepID=UPI0028A12DD3|nr:NTP transferase domain-containing protein [Proteiniclasticum sp.]